MEASGKTSVTINDIRDAAKSMDGSMLSRAVSTCTPFEALAIVSLSSIRQQTGRQNCSISELVVKMRGVASKSGEDIYQPSPTFGETIELLTRMSEIKLIIMETPKTSSIQSVFAGNTMGVLWPLVILNLDDHDIRMALKYTRHSKIVDVHVKGFDGF